MPMKQALGHDKYQLIDNEVGHKFTSYVQGRISLLWKQGYRQSGYPEDDSP